MVAGVPFRTCLPDQEEEATALGGTLLLPRPLLLRAARNGWDVDEVARRYGVTVEMARFRMNYHRSCATGRGPIGRSAPERRAEMWCGDPD
jgi:Zn-dependent peptidase ImmA (M78 family)